MNKRSRGLNPIIGSFCSLNFRSISFLMFTTFLHLSVTGCETRLPESAETIRLTQDVIPKIRAEIEAGRDVELSKAIPPSYNVLCILNEYGEVRSVGEVGKQSIDKYYSNFGNWVPEGDSALIFIRKGEAHAVLLGQGVLNFELAPIIPCRTISTGVLHFKGGKSRIYLLKEKSLW